MKKPKEKLERDFLKIPGFILQLTYKENKVTSEDKFYLSIIHQFPDTPTNKDMAYLINCGHSRESVIKRLHRLKNLGLVCDNKTNNQKRQLSINIPTDLLHNVDERGIIIDKFLMDELSSCSQRLVAATELWLTIASIEFKYWKVGMSSRSYIYNQNILNSNGLLDRFKQIKRQNKANSADNLLKTTADNLLKDADNLLFWETEIKKAANAVNHNSCEILTSSKSPGVYKGVNISSNIVSSILSSDNILDTSRLSPYGDQTACKLNFANPFSSKKLSLGDVTDLDTNHEINHDHAPNPKPKPKLELVKTDNITCTSSNETLTMTKAQIIALKHSSITTPLGNKRVKTKTKSRQKTCTKPSVELCMMYDNYPLLTRHKQGSKAQLNTEKVMRGLKNGLHTEFPDIIDVLVDKGLEHKLKRSECLIALHSKFSLKQRKEIYQKLNDLLDPRFKPRNKKYLPKNLYDALSPDPRYGKVSWLLYVICRDPEMLKRKAVKILDEEINLVLMEFPYLERLKSQLTDSICELNYWYRREFMAPYYNRNTIIGGEFGEWEWFFKRYVKFLEETYPTIEKAPGWFYPKSKPVKKWVDEINKFVYEIERDMKNSNFIPDGFEFLLYK